MPFLFPCQQLLCIACAIAWIDPSSFGVTGYSPVKTYKADIEPLEDSGVTATVLVFQGDDEGLVAYGGFATGLEPNLVAGNCTAKNGCGVHIHSGFGCENNETQLGHLFVEPVTEDPWTDERYSSNDDGDATFSGIVNIGTDDLNGRAFIVHSEDGTRVGCGLLTAVEAEDLLAADTEPLSSNGSDVMGSVTVYQVDDSDRVCFYGYARQLQPDLISYLSKEGGTDCNETNACGAHIHKGNGCENAETQGGHLYNGIEPDPWLLVGYLSTNDDGLAHFAHCLETGATEFNDRAFIVHDNAGGRVSCGILQKNESATSEVDTSAAVCLTLFIPAAMLSFFALIGL